MRRYLEGLGNSWDDKEALDARIGLLKQGEALPFQIKIGKTIALIMRAIQDHGPGKVYLGFSGGRDSAVLAHLVQGVEGLMGISPIQYVFGDTTLEDPSTYKYVKWWERTFDRAIHWTRPFMKPLDVIREYGYPLFSKRIAYMLQTNRRSQATIDYLRRIKLSHLLDSDVKISQECCYYLKHGPGEKYAQDNGFTAVMLGMRSSDSRDRRRNWLSKGCYYPVKEGCDRVHPLAFWTEKDVLEYHKRVGLPWAELYDKGFTRNGCRLCGFGCHRANPNKFELLAMHYPAFWRKGMERFGYFEVCEKLGIRDGRHIAVQLALRAKGE